jgi:hypothetical protein
MSNHRFLLRLLLGIAVELGYKLVPVLARQLGEVVDEALDLLTAGLAEIGDAAEVRILQPAKLTRF